MAYELCSNHKLLNWKGFNRSTYHEFHTHFLLLSSKSCMIWRGTCITKRRKDNNTLSYMHLSFSKCQEATGHNRDKCFVSHKFWNCEPYMPNIEALNWVVNKSDDRQESLTLIFTTPLQMDKFSPELYSPCHDERFNDNKVPSRMTRI